MYKTILYMHVVFHQVPGPRFAEDENCNRLLRCTIIMLCSTHTPASTVYIILDKSLLCSQNSELITNVRAIIIIITIVCYITCRDITRDTL
jgi:hypothetical protein